MRILSGVQPSGELHLGNYFGAILQHLRLQEEGDAFYFIADYHALTTVQEAEKLRECTRQVAATYVALGLDPPPWTAAGDVLESLVGSVSAFQGMNEEKIGPLGVRGAAATA